jgi:hypothetical protein
LFAGIVCAADLDGGSERIVVSRMAHASRVAIAPKTSIIDKRVIGSSHANLGVEPAARRP